MRRLAFFLFLLLFLTGTEDVFAFKGSGCAEGECRDCHSLDKSEAEGLLKKWVDKVNSVDYAEVPGLWVVEVEKKGRNYPLYIDFSKSFVISGSVVRVGDGENITKKLYNKFNSVDVSKIPLGDALILGNPGATTKVVVFTDPKCPYCKKLHVELRKVVEKSPETAFYIKLYPLKMHPEAYDISKSIICSMSMRMLEDSFMDRPVPKPSCETSIVDNTLKLVKSLGINSTPTMVMPSGTVVTGYLPADQILELIRKEKLAKSSNN
jgi:thiol:disulfide interchange protein DsbC